MLLISCNKFTDGPSLSFQCLRITPKYCSQGIWFSLHTSAEIRVFEPRLSLCLTIFEHLWNYLARMSLFYTFKTCADCCQCDLNTSDRIVVFHFQPIHREKETNCRKWSPTLALKLCSPESIFLKKKNPKPVVLFLSECISDSNLFLTRLVMFCFISPLSQFNTCSAHYSLTGCVSDGGCFS